MDGIKLKVKNNVFLYLVTLEKSHRARSEERDSEYSENDGSKNKSLRDIHSALLSCHKLEDYNVIFYYNQTRLTRLQAYSGRFLYSQKRAKPNKHNYRHCKLPQTYSLQFDLINLGLFGQK